MTTRVVHCKKEPYDVYIGRPSKWGNPYKIGPDGTREEVIQKYEQYLLRNNELLSSISELRGKVLGCWCAPNKCHGDVLVEFVEAQELYERIVEFWSREPEEPKTEKFLNEKN